MSNENITPCETPMLSSVLQTLITAGHITPKQIDRMLGLAERSSYMYLGKTDMTFSKVASIFDKSNEHVQRALLHALSDGNGWIHTKLDTNRDINGDGVIDTSDILAGGIAALDQLGRLLTIAHKSLKTGARSVTADRADAISAAVNQSITRLLEVQQVVSFLSQQTRRSA